MKMCFMFVQNQQSQIKTAWHMGSPMLQMQSSLGCTDFRSYDEQAVCQSLGVSDSQDKTTHQTYRSYLQLFLCILEIRNEKETINETGTLIFCEPEYWHSLEMLMLCYCPGNPLISDYSTYHKLETEVSYVGKKISSLLTHSGSSTATGFYHHFSTML